MFPGASRHIGTDRALSVARAVFMLGIVLSTAWAQDTGKPTGNSPSHSSHYEPSHFPKRAAMYYEYVWGVDQLSVKAAESGQLIRFSYRILDPVKARSFNDIKIEASLIDPERRVKLIVPSLEKVGFLRQRNTPEAGKRYWMAFSNPRLTVKRGDRVNVVIGQFHADGLVVE